MGAYLVEMIEMFRPIVYGCLRALVRQWRPLTWARYWWNDLVQPVSQLISYCGLVALCTCVSRSSCRYLCQVTGPLATGLNVLCRLILSMSVVGTPDTDSLYSRRWINCQRERDTSTWHLNMSQNVIHNVTFQHITDRNISLSKTHHGRLRYSAKYIW